MALNPIILSPTIAAEQAIANYISGSFSGSVYTYSGIDNADKINPPIAVVYCKSANEVYYNTRNYAFDIEIYVKDIAADSTKQNFDVLVGNIASLFADSPSGSASLNASTTGIKFWQIQIQTYTEDHSEDAWSSTLSYKFIGALTPY